MIEQDPQRRGLRPATTLRPASELRPASVGLVAGSPAVVAGPAVFGTATLSSTAVIAASGIAPRPASERFGSGAVELGPAVLSPTGIPPGPGGSGAEFGTVESVGGALVIAPPGVASTRSFGEYRVEIAEVELAPAGIAPTAAVGALVVFTGVFAPGLDATAVVGQPLLSTTTTLVPAGVVPGAVFGVPTAVSPTLAVRPPGLGSTAVVSGPALAPGRFLLLGIAPTDAVGFPTLSLPVAPEWARRFVVAQGPVVRRPASSESGTKYLTVDAATRRITNEFEFSDVKYSFERNAPGEFSGSIGLYDPETRFLQAQNTFLVVERGGEPFWTGFLWQPERSGKTLTVNAQGVWSIFGHRNIRESKDWDNIDRGQIVRDLVTYGQSGAGGDLGIAVGSELVGGDPLSYTANWWDKKSVAAVVEEIVKISPSFTFDIEGYWLPGNRLGLRLVIDPIHPRPTPHRLVYESNVDDYEWAPLSPSPNFVDGFGGFDNAAMLRRTQAASDLIGTAATDTSPAVPGTMIRIEGTVENRDLLNDDAVDKLAQEHLKKTAGSPSQPTVTMSAGADPPLGVLMPGHETEVVIDDGPYIHVDGSFIVRSLSVNVPNGAADSPGAETVSMEFESVIDESAMQDAS